MLNVKLEKLVEKFVVKVLLLFIKFSKFKMLVFFRVFVLFKKRKEMEFW